MATMDIFLILFASISLVASYENPVRYQWESLEHGRSPNLQVTQDYNQGFKSKPFHESHQAPQTNRQPNRDEYHKFGKDARPPSSEDDNLTRDYKSNEDQATQNGHFGILDMYSNKNKIEDKSVLNESPRNPKSSFQRQNPRPDSSFDYSPQIRTTLQSPEIRRADRENARGKASSTAEHSQGLLQKDTPLSGKRRSEIQADVYHNTFDGRLSSGRYQASLEEAAFQNRNDFRSPPVHDQQSQTRQVFYQNDAERDHAISDDNQYFKQIPYSTEEDQVTTFQVSQEQVNQYQNSTRQNQRSSIPLPPPFPKDNLFSPRQTSFDSRRFSSPITGQELQHISSADQKKYTTARFPNQAEGTFQNSRIITTTTDNEDVHITSGVHFKDEQNPNESRGQDIGSNIQVDYQRLFRSIGKHQPILTAPQFKHQTSVAVSGAKSASAPPVMVYKAGSIAYPHAVVLGKDSSVISKASMTQYLQTPYAQYTYNHSL